MSKESLWKWLAGVTVKTIFPELTKGGMSAYIDHLRTEFQKGLVDEEFLEAIASLLEEGAKTIRQMYGATGNRFMDEVRRKAKVQEVREEEK